MKELGRLIAVAMFAAFLLALGIAVGWTSENTAVQVFAFVFGPAAAVLCVWLTVRQTRVKLLPATLATVGSLLIAAPPLLLSVLRFVTEIQKDVEIVPALIVVLEAIDAPTRRDYLRVGAGLAVIFLAVLAMLVQRVTITIGPAIEREKGKTVESATDRLL